MRSSRRIAVVLSALLVATLLAAPIVPAGAAEGAEGFVPPVDAPVVDPFRPPATRFGPGNRGLAYDLASGTEVHASRSGVVVFAGRVAGALHLTVLHDDGLRSTYSYLGELLVARSDSVVAGQVVARGGGPFHFGVRDGSSYLDPAALFGGPRTVTVRLVPAGEPLPHFDAGPAKERRGVLDFIGSGVGKVVGVGREFLGRGVGMAEASVRLMVRRATRGLRFAVDVVEASVRFVDTLLRDCTPSSVAVPPPPGPRMAILVGGLGSSSENAAIDDLPTSELGYDPGSVIRFSYNGGRVPSDAAVAPGLDHLPVNTYESADTQGDLPAQGRRLADLIEQAAAARPGEPIDIHAHSQGGIVTRLALEELELRPGGLDLIGKVVTIGTPHDGADFATIGDIAGDLAPVVAGALSNAAMNVDVESVAVGQLAEDSALIDHLQEEGIPDGLDVTTIGGRSDWLVASGQAGVRGATHVTVGHWSFRAHDELPGHPETVREVQLALAGMPPSCQGALDAALDAFVPLAPGSLSTVLPV